MKDKNRKLAEKILEPIKFDDPEGGENVGTVDAMYAMQTYHEAKMKEVTDEDIERQVKQINRREALCTVDYYSTGFIEGAKAFRDGKIKHKEE